MCKLLKNGCFEQQCCEYWCQPRKLWRILNDLNGRSPNQVAPQASMTDLTKHFASMVHDPLRPSHLSPPSLNTVNHEVLVAKDNEPSCTSNYFKHPSLTKFSSVTIAEEFHYLQAIDDFKAEETDRTLAFILKQFTLSLSPSLTKIINASVSLVPRSHKTLIAVER